MTAPIKIGDKEILKGRPYTLLSTTLSTTPTQFAAVVPPFDPLKTGADRSGKIDAPLDVPPPQDDSEVAFTSRDIAPADLAAVDGELSLSQAVAQVVEFVRSEQAGERRFALAPQLMLMRTSRAGVDPLGALAFAPAGESPMFLSMSVRMVAENVTSVPRTVEAEADIAAERLLRPRPGSLSRPCCATMAPIRQSRPRSWRRSESGAASRRSPTDKRCCCNIPTPRILI